MTYTITNIDTDENVVALTVTFDDSSTYDKRMMCDTSTPESIKAGIETWLNQYIIDLAAQPASVPSVNAMVGKSVSFTPTEEPAQ